jgi:hypothetical protein
MDGQVSLLDKVDGVGRKMFVVRQLDHAVTGRRPDPLLEHLGRDEHLGRRAGLRSGLAHSSPSSGCWRRTGQGGSAALPQSNEHLLDDPIDQFGLHHLLPS